MRLQRLVYGLLACLMLAHPAAAQDTTAIKAALQRIDQDVDTIRKDKSRPAYVKRADSRIDSLWVPAVLKAMRVKVDTVIPVPPKPTPVPTTVQIHSNGSSIAVGQSLQLYSEVKDQNGVVLTAPVVWSVNSALIADISGTGVLSGKRAGTVTVSARASANAVTTRDYTVTGISPPDTSKPPVPPDTTKPPIPPDTITPPPSGGFDAFAELPRLSVDYTLPIGYTVVNVPAQAGALQSAIDNAPCRTELRGAPGFSYSPITLRVRPCNEKYSLILRTANGLPDVASGTRMTPAMSAARNQTRIVTTGVGNVSAITANAGVRGYYFEDVAIRATGGPLNALVYLGTQQTTLAQVPGDFVFRHVYTGATPTTDLKRCWYINSASFGLVDSWSDECHSNAGDSQWTLFLNGPGPYLLLNNHGEAGHEVVMFGGGDPSIQGLIPSDITIIGNHITRPIAWKGVWQVKNLLECKNARRMLVEGNVFENNWADAQTGYAFLCKSVNQDLSAPWSQSRDVTVRYNLFLNTGAGYNLCAVCQAPAVPSLAYSVHDNIMIGVNVGQFTGEAREWQFLGGLSQVSIVHNTTIGAAGVATAVSLDGQPPLITSMNFVCNAYDDGQYGIHSGNGGQWQKNFDMNTTTWTDNFGYPAGQWSQSGFDSKGYYTGPKRCADGRPLGADAAQVYAKTARAVVASGFLGAPKVATPRQSGWTPTDSLTRVRNTQGGVGAH